MFNVFLFSISFDFWMFLFATKIYVLWNWINWIRTGLEINVAVWGFFAEFWTPFITVKTKKSCLVSWSFPTLSSSFKIPFRCLQFANHQIKKQQILPFHFISFSFIISFSTEKILWFVCLQICCCFLKRKYIIDWLKYLKIYGVKWVKMINSLLITSGLSWCAWKC